MCRANQESEPSLALPLKSRGDIGPETRKALQTCEEALLDGLRHGFFQFEITCEIIKGKKRRLLLKAGKSYCFIIPEGEIRST